MIRATHGRATGALLALALLAPAACTSDPPSNPPPRESSVTTSTEPTTSTADLLCGFVPREPVVAALGASATGSGQVLGSGPARTGSCVVTTPDSDLPAMEVYLGPAVDNSVGPDAAMIVHDLAENAENPDWTTYPDGQGWAHPQYEATVDGQPVTGALSYLAWGDYVVGVRLFRPRPGHDAVKDAMAVVSAVPPALGLAEQPSRPYPSYSAG